MMPATEAMLTMDPSPALRIAAATSRASANGATRLTRTSRSKSSGDCRRAGLMSAAPALLTRPSTSLLSRRAGPHTADLSQRRSSRGTSSGSEGKLQQLAAARDRDLLTGDVPGFLGGQERHERGDLGRLAEPARAEEAAGGEPLE